MEILSADLGPRSEGQVLDHLPQQGGALASKLKRGFTGDFMG